MLKAKRDTNGAKFETTDEILEDKGSFQRFIGKLLYLTITGQISHMLFKF